MRTSRSKPSWWTKYRDAEIRERWTEEALSQTIGGVHLRKEHVQYVLEELEDVDSARVEMGQIQPSVQRGIWEAETLIPHDLRDKLDGEIAKLREVPDAEKDWHPGSDNQVLDLVHPSL